MHPPEKGVRTVTIREQLAQTLARLRIDLRKSTFKKLVPTAFQYEGRLSRKVITEALRKEKTKRLNEELVAFEKANQRDRKQAFPSILRKYQALDRTLNKRLQGQSAQEAVEDTVFRRRENRKRALRLEIARHLDGQLEQERLRHRKSMRNATNPQEKRLLTQIHETMVEISKNVHQSIPIRQVLQNNQDWRRYLEGDD